MLQGTQIQNSAQGSLFSGNPIPETLTPPQLKTQQALSQPSLPQPKAHQPLSQPSLSLNPNKHTLTQTNSYTSATHKF